MNQKGFANIILIVLIVVLVGIVGYLTLVKKSPSRFDISTTQQAEQPTTNNSLTSEQITNTTPPKVTDALLKNTIVKTKSEMIDSIDINIEEYKFDFALEDYKTIIENYDARVWNKVLLEQPAYPPMYKLTRKENPSYQVAIWYSKNLLIKVSGLNIFVDGSPAENILEKQAERFPSTVPLGR